MAQQYNINNIKSISPTYTSDGYVGACAIDPDKKINDRIGGAISPTNYQGISGLDGSKWLLTNDKTEDTYYYTKDGNFGYIDASGVISDITSVSGSGNGLSYYNNYYYIATDTDVHRYGPLDGTPQLEENWWSGIRQGDITVQGQGDWQSVGDGSKDKISQSLDEKIDFKKLYLGLKNTGTDTDYNIKVSIQGVEESDVQPLGTTYGDFTYKLKEPDGEILAEKTIPAPSNTEEIVEIEFDEIVEIDEPATIVIEIDGGADPDQTFEVMISDFGNVYKDEMMSTYDGGWETTPTLVWDTDTSGKQEASPGVVHTYSLLLKDEDILKDVLEVRFRIRPVAGTDDWAFFLRKNGSTLSSSFVSVVVYDNSNNQLFESSNSSSITSHDVGVSSTTEVNVAFTIRKEAEINHDDDVIQIYGDCIDDEEDPVDSRIADYRPEGTFKRYPYFFYQDIKRAEDIGFTLQNADTEFRPLKDITHPEIGAYQIPSHSIHLHAQRDSLYLCDKMQDGIIHTINTGNVLTVKTTDEFKPNDLIVGKSSNTKATVIIVEELFELGERRLNLTIDNVIGEFEDEETIKVIGKDSEAEVDGELIEGYSNQFSEAAALRLPKKFTPISTASYGSDVAIIAISNDKTASMFLWDTFANSFQREIKLPFNIVTAIFSHNGTLYIWGGDDNGYSLYAYAGGDTVQPITHIDNGLPPLQGAIDAIGNRLMWGSSQIYPEERGCVWAMGSRGGTGGLHNIASTDSQVSSIIYKNELKIGADKFYTSGGDYDSVWRSEMLNFGRPFTLQKITIPLGEDLGENDEIHVNVLYDNEKSSYDKKIEMGDYENRNISIYPEMVGIQNAIIEIKIKGETFIPVLFPISIDYELYE